jgi:hypothetical protein
MTFTDHIVDIIRTATPAERELASARNQLEDLRDALRPDAWPVRNVHPGGAPTAMNRAWRIAMATASTAQRQRWHAVGVTVIALQDVSEREAASEAMVSAAATGSAVAGEIAAVLASSTAANRWSHRSVAGLLGAGAAAGRLLELDEAQLRNAVGLCATQAAGLHEVDESESGIVQIAKVSADAVEAAVLARHGFTSSADGLSGRRGLFALLVPDAAWQGESARSEGSAVAGTFGVR